MRVYKSNIEMLRAARGRVKTFTPSIRWDIMTKAELVKCAENLGIKTGKMTKTELIEKIKEAM